MEGLEVADLLLLLGLGAADELRGAQFLGRGVQEGVHAHDGQLSAVLEVLVVHGLFLDLAPLVHRLHGAQHAAAVRDAAEFEEHRLLHQLRELLDEEGTLEGVLVLRLAQLPVDDELDGDGPAHALLGGRGDGLVVGIGVQAVAVVVDGVEGLQRRADVVEVDLLGVQRAAARLDVVLQLLAAVVGAVLLLHGHGPDAPGHAADDAVLGIQAVAEEEAEVRREVVDVHAAGQVVLDEGEAVGQGEGQLADGIRARLGDVVPADAHRVEVADLLLDEGLLDVTHDLEAELRAEDAGVLGLVLLEDVGLHRAAHGLEGLGPQLGVDLRRQHLVGGGAQERKAQPVVAVRQRLSVAGSSQALGRVLRVDLRLGGLQLPVLLQPELRPLVDGRVEEEGQHGGRGAVDGHAHAGGGAQQVETRVELLGVVHGADGHAAVADLAVDVGTDMGIFAIERHAVEGRAEPYGRLALAHIVEALVGALGRALAGEHAGGILAHALVFEDARRVGEAARQVLQQLPAEQVAPPGVGGQGHLGHHGAAEGQRVVRRADLPAPDHIDILGLGVAALQLGPVVDEAAALAVQLAQVLLVALAQHHDGRTLVALPGVGEVGGVVESASRRHPVAQGLQADPEGMGQLGGRRLPPGPGFVALHGIGDLGQVAHPLRRDDGGPAGAPGLGLQLRGPVHAGLGRQDLHQVHEEPVGGRVVELAGAGGVDGHVLGGFAEPLVGPLVLLAHVAQGVLGPALVGLVEHHEVREVQHVDLLELAGGTVFRRHHIHGEIHQVRDLAVALADARGLHDHQVVALGLGHGDAGHQGLAGGAVGRAARGEAPHEDPVAQLRMVEGVHADAVAQQGAAGLALGGVHAEHGHPLVREVHQEAPQQLVDERGLAGATRTRDAQDGNLACGLSGVAHGAELDLGDLPGQGLRHGLGARIEVAARHHVVDHALEAHVPAILGAVDAGHAVGLQLADLVGDDDAATPAEDLDVAGAALPQQVHHVLEELHMAALVAGEGDALGVLLDGRLHDVLHGAVVAQVDHLAAGGLDDAAHDVDGRVVAVEEAGGRDEADLVLRRVAVGCKNRGIRRGECGHGIPHSGESPVYRGIRPP